MCACVSPHLLVCASNRWPGAQVLRVSPLTCLKCGCLQDWQGRSWNRLNLHNHLHRAHYTRHIVANALSQRSLSPPHSPPDQLHDTSGSLSRVRHLPAQGVAGGPSRDVTEGVLDTSARLASNAAASSAERPLPEQTYRHSLDSAPAESRHTGAEAVVGEPRVKRQLLINGMHRGGPSAYPLLVNGHPPTELSRSVGASQLASQAKAVGITPGTGATPPGGSAAPAVDHSPLAAGAAADSMRLSAPPENGRLGTQYQQQEVTAQINSSITQRAGPASVKAFLSGIRPDPAPWDDVDPALAKDRAALNR